MNTKTLTKEWLGWSVLQATLGVALITVGSSCFSVWPANVCQALIFSGGSLLTLGAWRSNQFYLWFGQGVVTACGAAAWLYFLIGFETTLPLLLIFSLACLLFTLGYHRVQTIWSRRLTYLGFFCLAIGFGGTPELWGPLYYALVLALGAIFMIIGNAVFLLRKEQTAIDDPHQQYGAVVSNWAFLVLNVLFIIPHAQTMIQLL